jgi:hypothetical protein
VSRDALGWNYGEISLQQDTRVYGPALNLMDTLGDTANSGRHHLNSLQQIALLFRRLMSFSQFSEPITSSSEFADDKIHLTNEQTRVTVYAYI